MFGGTADFRSITSPREPAGGGKTRLSKIQKINQVKLNTPKKSASAKLSPQQQQLLNAGKKKAERISAANVRASDVYIRQRTGSTRSGVVNGDITDAKRYARALLEPVKYAIRIPEAGPSPTTLISTKRVIDVPMFLIGDKYRYAGVFQPKFGLPGVPNTFQSAFVDFSKGVAGANPPLNFESSWRQVINGVNVTTDPNMAVLVAPRLFSATFGVIRAAMPGAPNAFFANAAYLKNNGNNLATDTTTLNFGTNGMVSELKLPAGSWTISLQTLVNVTGASTLPVMIRVVTNGVVGPLLSPDPETPLDVNPGAKQYYAIYNIVLRETQYLQFIPDPDVAVTYQNVVVSVATSSIPRVNTSVEFGMLEKVRPVAMSVLATCTTSAAYAGGRCATVLTTGGMDDKIFCTDPTWCSVDGISQMATQNQYTGEFAKGSFCWWRPVTSEVCDWYDPIPSVNHQFPLILIAGSIPSVANVTAPSMTVTLEVVFEVQQNSQLFTKGHSASTTAAREMALNSVAELITATENPGHHDLFGDLGSAVGGWAGKLLGSIF